MLDGELTGRDDAFGLVTDVEQDLVTIDLDDGAFDDVAIVEVLDRCVDGGEEVLGGAMSFTATCGEVTVVEGMC